MGCFCFAGIGVEKDEVRAVKFWQRASDAGLPAAINYLGCCFSSGDGIEKDFQKAAALYQRAADAGWLDAFQNLGILYIDGSGVEKDLKKGEELTLKVAEQGDAVANNTIAEYYQEDTFGELNLSKAIHHFEKAAQLGHVASLVELARIYEGEEDEEKAAEYFTQAAERRHPTAQVTLGLWETEGRVGPVPNLHKAFHWFSLAADQGKAKGFAYLRQMYLDGEGVEKNTEKGIELIQSAAAKNNPGFSVTAVLSQPL